MASSGAGLVGGALAAGVGHASTARPDPSTLGMVGERGSHHEGRPRPTPGSADGTISDQRSAPHPAAGQGCPLLSSEARAVE